MYRRIDQEIKDKIINKIKSEGMTVKQASEEFGISGKSIYGWIGARGRVEPGLIAINKLRKENEQLKQIIGSLTLNMERGKKNI